MAFSTCFKPEYLTFSPVTDSPTAEPQSQADTGIVVSVFPFWYKYVTLEWKVPASYGPCTYHVYANYGADSEFVRLTGSAISEPNFSDPNPRENSKLRKAFYIVEAITLSGQVFKSLPASNDFVQRGYLGRISSEIQRREFLLLTKFNGVKSFLFRRKTFGLRCPRCWNPNSEKATDDKCPVCYGTSFKGGYQPPLPIFLNFDPTSSSRDLEYFGPMEQNQIGAWTISVPAVDPWDVIIRTGDWSAYHVARLNTTEMQTSLVRQLLVLTQLNRSDIQNTLMALVPKDSGDYLNGLGGPYSTTRFPRGPVTNTTSDDYPWMSEQTVQGLPQQPKYNL